jgi:hypothetical protein
VRTVFRTLLIATVLVIALFWSFGGHFPYPTPYAGPYKGTVINAATEAPIPEAVIEAIWWCHDNPLPDGPGHYQIITKSRSDESGRFQIKTSSRRGGWFGTDFHLRVIAGGYIESVQIFDTRNNPLPKETRDWPFVDTSIFQYPPSNLTVRMKPAKPILLEALESKNPLIRETAADELKKLK